MTFFSGAMKWCLCAVSLRTAEQMVIPWGPICRPLPLNINKCQPLEARPEQGFCSRTEAGIDAVELMVYCIEDID